MKFFSANGEADSAIVAEIELNVKPMPIGFALIATESDNRATEIAVFVEDGWKGKGLGGLLSEMLMLVARRWPSNGTASNKVPEITSDAIPGSYLYVITYDLDRGGRGK
jgi:hypothetical protein